MGYIVTRANTQPSVPKEKPQSYGGKGIHCPGVFYDRLDVSDEPFSIFSGLRHHSTVATKGLNKRVQSDTPGGSGQLSIEDGPIGAEPSCGVSWPRLGLVFS